MIPTITTTLADTFLIACGTACAQLRCGRGHLPRGIAVAGRGDRWRGVDH